MALKSLRSVRSIRSIQTLQSSSTLLSSLSDVEKVIGFGEFLTLTCAKFNCPYQVIVKLEYPRHHDGTPARTPVTSARKASNTTAAPKDEENDSQEALLVVTAVYDDMNRLAEIVLNKVPILPRVVMQVIALVVPFHQHMYKISIRRCGVDLYTVYELNKMLPLTNLTEICLDESPFPQANYAILLEQPSHLQNLSLCRCRINDEVCEQMASKLHLSASAEKHLLLLNLSSNHITDEGVKHFSEALRTNRHLRYLNLAHNRITDDGAAHILDTLKQFPLTYNELLDKRERYLYYLKFKMRKPCFMRNLNSYDGSSVTGDDTSQFVKKTSRKGSEPSEFSLKKTSRKIKKSASPHHHASKSAMHVRGTDYFQDPFDNNSVMVKNDWSYCHGNMVLCYLNLAYNGLSYFSVKKILTVLRHQNSILKTHDHKTGLVKIVIDGNDLPVWCPETADIDDLINRNLTRLSGKAPRKEFFKKKRLSTAIETAPKRGSAKK